MTNDKKNPESNLNGELQNFETWREIRNGEESGICHCCVNQKIKLINILKVSVLEIFLKFYYM